MGNIIIHAEATDPVLEAPCLTSLTHSSHAQFNTPCLKQNKGNIHHTPKHVAVSKAAYKRRMSVKREVGDRKGHIIDHLRRN